MSLFERIQSKRYDLQEKRVIKKKYGNKNSGGFEDVTGENIKKGDYPNTRKELEAKRKYYEIDPKTNQPSKSGVEKYARKHRQLSSGSNIPVELTQADLDKAKQNMVGGRQIKNKKGDVIGRTTGKIGGRLAKKRSKNNKSYAELMADINKRNPTINTPIGKLPKTAANVKKFKNYNSFMGRAKNIGSKGLNKFKKLPKGGKAAAVVGGLALLGVAGNALFGGKKSKDLSPAPSSELRKLSYSKYVDAKTNKPISYTFGAGKYDKDKNPEGNKINFPINSPESKKALAAGLKNKSLYLSKKIKPS
tara:strand:- start:108 stop:1022 length:915 start_codon:yes stop_codon:yes gene_type:complete